MKIVIEGSAENLFEAGGGKRPEFLREMGKRDRDFLYHGKNSFSLSNTLG